MENKIVFGKDLIKVLEKEYKLKKLDTIPKRYRNGVSVIDLVYGYDESKPLIQFTIDAKTDEFICGDIDPDSDNFIEFASYDDLNLITKIKSEKPIMEEKMKIRIKYLDDSIERVSKIEKGDWIDLRSAENVELKKGEFKLIPLGVAMELPEGYEAHVVPRSSTFNKWGIIETNSMGIIDESYKGDDDFWFFPAYAMRDTVIEKGDRICQFRIIEKMPSVEFETVEILGNENRGGHGSTGSK